MAERKALACDLVNMDEDLLLVELRQVKRLLGYPFPHIFGEGQMDRLHVIIVKTLYGVDRRKTENGKNISDGCK